jgi:tyrosyl-tRNA synthetase
MTRMVEEEAALFMQGAEFGDVEIAQWMARALRERLYEARAAGRPLRVYCGYDATRPDLHLGHTITLRKLRQFQECGHDVTVVVGDFTTRVGDPSDRDGLRPQLSPDQIADNARTYADQALKVLDRATTHVRFNSEWLAALDLADVIRIAGNFTVQQFLARENLRARHDRGDPVWLHELFYAMLQGYDAVALGTDVQIGGTEQLFNLLAGRKLQEAFGLAPQVCITFPILVGTDGRTRMSKSAGNYIGIDEPPAEMYGKVMSLPDEVMSSYFRLVTHWTPAEVARVEARLAAGELHPMEAKKALAWEIVDCYHGREAADAAAAHFGRVHQQGKAPVDVPHFALDAPMPVPDLLEAAGMCASRSEGRRLVQQGGVRLDGRVVGSVEQVVPPGEYLLQVGKRRFVRLVAAREEGERDVHTALSDGG